MSDMATIHLALVSAQFDAQTRLSGLLTHDQRDWTRQRLRSFTEALAAHDRLSQQLREGRMHVAPPEDFKATGCMCSWPTVSPPCTWCTDPDQGEET